MHARSARSLAAEARFRARLAELGAELLEPVWLGVNKPHRVRCAAGHERTARPNHVLNGHGFCRICGQAANPRHSRVSQRGEARFRARLAELGAELLEPQWLGSSVPHRAQCAAGHECTPTPSFVVAGGGICRTCARRDPAAAEAAFRARLADLGAELLEPVWLGAQVPHRVRCAAGHVTTPRPDNVANGGRGLCRYCKGSVWDVFYVVTDTLGERVKFGITSGDPRPRLGVHRAAGYGVVVLMLEGLPGTLAPEIESAALAALDLAGLEPLYGREYFSGEALAVVLDIAGNYPGSRASDAPPMRMQYIV